MQDRKGLIIGIILGSLLIVCLCCFAVFGGGAIAFSQWLEQTEVFCTANTGPTADNDSGIFQINRLTGNLAAFNNAFEFCR